MYEILLQWGLESITKLVTDEASDQSGKDIAILLEAVRTKNALVLERFRYAWNACQSIVDLALQVDIELADFRSTAPETDGTVEGAKKFMGKLKQEFHPKHYRQLLKLRSQLESTSDLLAAYSIVMTDIIRFDMVENITITKEQRSASDITRTYRGLWTFYSEVLTRLVRLTSNDLRFWLTDKPYIDHAEEWAKRDLKAANNFLLAKNWGGRYFRLSLETEKGLEEFWKL